MLNTSIFTLIAVAFYSLLPLSLASPTLASAPELADRAEGNPTVSPNQSQSTFGSGCGPNYLSCKCRDKGVCCPKNGDCCSYNLCCPDGYHCFLNNSGAISCCRNDLTCDEY
ncbi:hypothetical protein BDV93DRAFT_555325 [Ceratobasidium sp. AG-I]|nr:hypothetical protein BDV93DRAFT_555325 [Ceratobasidium sp. AG-I]